MNDTIETIRRETKDLPAKELLRNVVERFGDRVALASSMGVEDQVITSLLHQVCRSPRIFTLDTGRLPQETYDTIEATHEKYGVGIRLLFPDSGEVEAMVNEHGPNLFTTSVAARKRCCHVRKVAPLRRELAKLDAWITGLRRDQAVTRQDIDRVEWDDANGLVKINPLADWTTDQVWDYVSAHGVPYNSLHDQGYPSIGCRPCTRAVAEGQDVRAGRWWWEQAQPKECGLHVVDGRLTRVKG